MRILIVEDEFKLALLVSERLKNDYITKPFHMDELVARVNIRLRGAFTKEEMGKLTFGDIELDTKNSTLIISKDSEYYESAPMFFVTNTDALINLTNIKLSFGSGTLLNVKGTDEWGTSLTAIRFM